MCCTVTAPMSSIRIVMADPESGTINNRENNQRFYVASKRHFSNCYYDVPGTPEVVLHPDKGAMSYRYNRHTQFGQALAV